MSNNSNRKEKISDLASVESAASAESAVEILNLIKCYNDKVQAEENKLLSIWGMTVLQYNALHVIYLKDDEKIGISSREIGEGLNERVPDLTRLLDRLADKKWVIRERDEKNRRVVRTRLTEIGQELVDSADSPLKELQENLLANLDEKEKVVFLGLLKKL